MDKIIASIVILALMVGFLMFTTCGMEERVSVLEKHDLVANYEKHKTTIQLPEVEWVPVLDTDKDKPNNGR